MSPHATAAIARTGKDAHELIILDVRTAIDKTARNGAQGSNDLLTSEMLRRHELRVWFLSAHLVDIPLVEA